MKTSNKISLEWFEIPLYEPCRFKMLYGGRGGGKSTAMAKALLYISCTKECLIVCAREFHNSLGDSVYVLLSSLIRSNEYYLSVFDITKQEIVNKVTGSVFKFKGLGDKVDSIRSLQGITHFWIEEGQRISAYSWSVLLPTIRQPGSEIWITMNPINESDILYKEFVLGADSYGKDLYLQKVSWRDNPYLSAESVKDMLRCKKRDYSKYLNDWEGECLYNSEAQVFKQKVHWNIEEFVEPPRVHPYYGLDFGFSPKHPTVGIRCYIHENKLYITHEAYAKELLLNKIAKFLRDKLPDLDRYYIYADNARPDNIAHLKSVDSLRIKPVEKGKGTVEDGIEYMKTFDIIIHPRCVETIKEFTLYSYQVDARSGDIKRDLVKDNDHCLVGDTLVDTKDGQFKIRDLVGLAGEVKSIADDGKIKFNQYSHVRLTEKNAQVFKCALSDGRSITCTKDHFFLTVDRGWRPLFDIRNGDKLVVLSDALRYNIEKNKRKLLCLNTFILKVLNLLETIKQTIIYTLQPVKGCIDMSMNQFMGKYQQIITFITKIITSSIMILQISFVYYKRSIVNIMEKTLAKSRERSLKLILIKSDPLLNYGINQKRGESGIRNIGLNLFYLQLSKRLIKYVIFAKKYIHCQKQKLMRVNFVATLANPLTEENKEWITFKNNVLYVEKNSLQINILKLKHVAFTAEQSSVTVIAIEEDGYQDVYNLEVENDHNYTIENGIVTHNCIDSIRYGLERLMKRRVIDYSKWRE